MNGMQLVTLAMYLVVVVLWVLMAVRVLRAGKDATRNAKKNLVVMSVIVLGLTAMQLFGNSQ